MLELLLSNSPNPPCSVWKLKICSINFSLVHNASEGISDFHPSKAINAQIGQLDVSDAIDLLLYSFSNKFTSLTFCGFLPIASNVIITLAKSVARILSTFSFTCFSTLA